MREQEGYTALMLAALKGSAECAAALLAADGIDVNVADEVRHSVQNHTCHALVHCVNARHLSCRCHAPFQFRVPSVHTALSTLGSHVNPLMRGLWCVISAATRR